MCNAQPTLWLATAYLALVVRALPRPHPAATYQVVDVGGPTSSSALAEIVYETVAITKSSKPKTVTEPPLTVTVTPTVLTTTSATSTSVASSTTTEQESAARPSNYHTSIGKSPIPTLALSTSVDKPTTTSIAAYVPETTPLSTIPLSSSTASSLTTSSSVAAYKESIKTWTSAQPTVATSLSVHAPSPVSSWTESAAWTEAPATVQPTSIWSPSPTMAMQTVYETVYVAAPTDTSSAPAKSAFPTYAVPWNATQHSANATLSASQTHTSAWKAPKNIHLAATQTPSSSCLDLDLQAHPTQPLPLCSLGIPTVLSYHNTSGLLPSWTASANLEDSTSPPPVEDQARLLEDALTVVRQQAVLMRRCLETPGKLMDALKCSSTLVSELRTSSLGPKQYYELYMSVFDALRHLSVYLRESHPVNHLADLYELVQYAGNIVPRLYLMITVGTVYMGIADAPVKEIMKDMMEMSRGVQHPVRGLFLRYYLSGQARDSLPEGSEDGPEGNLQDSISFILTNFVEMNKLWVRLQHQGHSREREQRTKERQELQLLVGSNLVRLSQLVDLESYRNVILEPLLEQVVQCRDVLAQEYLLEVITQVFPDEFHLHTLDQLLAATARLNPHVNVKAIVIGLMDRLSAFAARESESQAPEDRQRTEEASVAALLEKLNVVKDIAEKEPEAKSTEPAEPINGESKSVADDTVSAPAAEETDSATPAQTNGDSEKHKGIPANIKLFEIFYEQVIHLVTVQRLSIQDITALLVSLVNLALNIYPERLDYVDQVLHYATKEVTRYANAPDLHSQASQSNLLSLLLGPVKTYCSLFTALALPNFVPLYQQQPYPTRRSVAGEVARSLLRNETKITTAAHLEGVLQILSVLVNEGMQQPSGYSGGPARRGAVETDETVEEQGWLARIVHLVKGADNITQFKLLQKAKTAFQEGNERTKYTTPALITQSLKLARSFKRREHLSIDDYATQSSAVYKFMHGILSSLYTRVSAAGVPDLVLRLFVSCGQVASQCENEDVSYEFFAQAFTVYEESISDSRSQFQAICIIAGALSGCSDKFSRENYDTLITKAALHGSKLLKKPDQCRAVYLASHLWWTAEKGEKQEEGKESYRDGKRVLECLQRALRVADACMDTAVSVELFVEILNRYVYYFDQENDAVTTKYLNGLIELIHSNLNTTENASGLDQPRKHFQRTLDYIASREYEGVETRQK